jgi:hypothetical protein
MRINEKAINGLFAARGTQRTRRFNDKLALARDSEFGAVCFGKLVSACGGGGPSARGGGIRYWLSYPLRNTAHAQSSMCLLRVEARSTYERPDLPGRHSAPRRSTAQHSYRCKAVPCRVNLNKKFFLLLFALERRAGRGGL